MRTSIQSKGHIDKKNNLYRKKIGNEGENRSLDYLIENNYEIIQRNWRTRFGEIDIIALKNSVLVFIEVKTHPKGSCFTANFSLGLTKQKKIIQTSKYFLDLYRQYNEYLIRYDVILIDVPGFTPVYHIENAFWECSC